jgi:glutamate N-acetyltransferase/amino-acid N-acetyltransferase
MLCRTVGAPTFEIARGVGKAVVNSPLFKSAVAGNDPNVGRLVSTVGSYLGRVAPTLDLGACVMSMGGRCIFQRGEFTIDQAVEDELYGHMCDALLSSPEGDSLPYPPHERCVEIEVNLGAGDAMCTVHGSDLTKEYVAINADYRS